MSKHYVIDTMTSSKKSIAYVCEFSELVICYEEKVNLYMWTKRRVPTCGTEFLSPWAVRMRGVVRMRRHKSCIFIAQMT